MCSSVAGGGWGSCRGYIFVCRGGFVDLILFTFSYFDVNLVGHT